MLDEATAVDVAGVLKGRNKATRTTIVDAEIPVCEIADAPGRVVQIDEQDELNPGTPTVVSRHCRERPVPHAQVGL